MNKPTITFRKNQPVSSVGLSASVFSFNLSLVENPLGTHWVDLVEPLDLSDGEEWRIALMMGEADVCFAIFGANIGLITHVFAPLLHGKIFPFLMRCAYRLQPLANHRAGWQRPRKIPHILGILDHWQGMAAHQKRPLKAFLDVQACLFSC
jgi:hypothetical protein